MLVNLANVNSIKTRERGQGGRITFQTGNGIDIRELPQHIPELMIDQSVELLAKLIPKMRDLL